MKLKTSSGDSVLELSQAKLSGQGSVDFRVGLEVVVVRNFEKDGGVVVLMMVKVFVVVRSVELRKLCVSVKDGNFAGFHQFWEDSVVFLFSATTSSFTAAKVGVFVNHRNADGLGVVFFRFGLFVLGLVLSGGFLFDEEPLWNRG